MTRHGIVVSGVGTLQQCGGPAFCAICNAEMIALEFNALRIAQRYEERMGREFDDPEMLTKRWQSPIYSKQFRKQARNLVMLQEKQRLRLLTREGRSEATKARAERWQREKWRAYEKENKRGIYEHN